MFKKLINITNRNKSELFMLIDQALVSGVNFVIAILLARFLGVDHFGLFAFGWMLVLFASSIHLAFIIFPLYTLYPKHGEKAKYLASTHIIQLLFTLFTFLASTLILKIVFIYQPDWHIEGITFSLPATAALFCLQDFYRRVNFTKKQPLKSFVTDCIAYGLQPLAIFTLYQTNTLTIHTSLMAISGLYLLAILYSYWSLQLSFNTLLIKETLSEKWQFSKYLIGTALLQWLSGNFFIIVAGGVLGPIAIGAIRIAQNVVGILHVLFSVMENSIPIKGAEILAEKGIQKAVHFFKKSFFQGGAITLVILSLIAVFTTQIIDLFYGAEYLPYTNVLLCFTGLYLFVFTSTIMNFVLRTFELNQVFFWSYITTTVFSLITAKFLIDTLGVYGVMAGLLLTQIINIGFYVVKLNQKIKLFWK